MLFSKVRKEEFELLGLGRYAIKSGDLVRFKQHGKLASQFGFWRTGVNYWIIGLCISYDKVQGIVKILHKGQVISKQKWDVEKAGKKDIEFRRLDETR